MMAIAVLLSYASIANGENARFANDLVKYTHEVYYCVWYGDYMQQNFVGISKISHIRRVYQK